jgi:hypothetical protein
LVILLLYAGLLLPTVGRQGISWDEQNDLWVAQAYLALQAGWLVGSDIDASQTRLPMAAVALAYEILGVSDLVIARLVSCLVGGLTLLGVYILGKERFSAVVGLLACLLLAASPFFLSFARVAFTETDIYLACAFAWLWVCVIRLQNRPSLGWAAAVGVFFGLALSAKFTALVVLPAVWVAAWQSSSKLPSGLTQDKSGLLDFWTPWLFAASFIGVSAANTDLPEGQVGLLYALVLLSWLLPLAWAFYRRQAPASRSTLVLYITGLALLTFLVLPPEHLTNPAIMQSLIWRMENELAFRPAFMLEAAGLHVGSLIFKSGPLVGAGLLLGVFFSALQWKEQPRVRFPVLLIFFYFGGLVILPLAQTFYIVPLLPLLAVLGALQFLRLLARRRVIALGLAALAAILWVNDLRLSYPDYNLNGYQWLGERVIFGRSSLGYRSIVQTPSDGVEQVVRWLNEHAQPGERVRSYLLEWHIVQAVAPHPAYRIEDGFSARYPNAEYLGVPIYRWFVDNNPFASPRPNPDYVVVEINTQVRQSWWMEVSDDNVYKPPYKEEWLEANYDKVFSVRRAFGIEMASVWKKK